MIIINSLYVQLAFITVVYPCLIVQYMGQAAYLSKNVSSISNSFYDSIPGWFSFIKTVCTTLYV